MLGPLYRNSFRSEDRRYLGLKKACARSEDRVGNVRLVHDFPTSSPQSSQTSTYRICFDSFE